MDGGSAIRLSGTIIAALHLPHAAQCAVFLVPTLLRGNAYHGMGYHAGAWEPE